ncbi:MAG: hypothetical protein QOE82_2074 [Thermoanaerobaculia bacterium]|jgi:hypothetical protein|nr:hypothetical protein [Thermoanaerobaculia bacterium]
MTHRARAASLAVVLCVIATFAAAQQDREQPPPSQMYKQYAGGLLARTVYTSDVNGRFRMEVWNLLIGPGKHTAPFRLPGGAVLDVRGGSGNVVISGKEQRFRVGTTMRADDGSEIVLVNASPDSPMTIRAVIVVAR